MERERTRLWKSRNACLCKGLFKVLGGFHGLCSQGSPIPMQEVKEKPQSTRGGSLGTEVTTSHQEHI